MPSFVKLPVKFPVIREFGTGDGFELDCFVSQPVRSLDFSHHSAQQCPQIRAFSRVLESLKLPDSDQISVWPESLSIIPRKWPFCRVKMWRLDRTALRGEGDRIRAKCLDPHPTIQRFFRCVWAIAFRSSSLTLLMGIAIHSVSPRRNKVSS